MDRNITLPPFYAFSKVALRKESVDRNASALLVYLALIRSLSARRAWIEITVCLILPLSGSVALRKESVDRNDNKLDTIIDTLQSLSARRAWIEMLLAM